MKNEQKEFTGIVNPSYIKTIDIHEKTWRDRTYGNNYAAYQVTINYGTPEQLTLCKPFSYDSENSDSEIGALLMDCDRRDVSLYRVAQEYGIIVRRFSEKTRKRDTQDWGDAFPAIPRKYLI